MNLINYISNIGIKGSKLIEENIDEQYKALKFLNNHLKGQAFIDAVVKNALISYQLTGTGEQYWWEFAKFFSKNPSFENFLKSCRYNKRYINVKLNRLKKIDFSIEGDMLSLKKRLEEALQSEGKTINFAIKMYGYAIRIEYKKFIPYPFEIPIPLDSRILKLTKVLTNQDPIEYWNYIALRSKVPPLHIDSIIWPQLSKDKFILAKYENLGIPTLDLEILEKI
jgi:DNA-(apurinic or apyrimidinic site) lyase